MRTILAKLEWQPSSHGERLCVVSSTRIACIASYFKNAAGTVTALHRTYATTRGAKRAIERAFAMKRKKRA